MNRASAIRQQVGVWGLILGLWFLVVLSFAGQMVFTGGLNWLPALEIAFRDWLPWLALAPITAWLAWTFPLERGCLAASIPVHIGACLLALLFADLFVPIAGPPPRLLPGGPQFLPPLAGQDTERPFAPEPRPRQPAEPLPERPYGAPRPETRRALFLNTRAKFNLPIYWIVVSIVQALRFQRRSQERERKALELEARLAEAKLSALRMQLHPHFLFNTLNAIATLVHKDPEAADEMIVNLGELLRATLDTQAQEIPLRQELEFLDRYLAIQQVRFGDRLQVEKHIDAGTLEARVPTLILQPLVENAIRYGIEPNPGPGLLSLMAQRREDMLQLTIRDSGSPQGKPAPTSSGIGLVNTKARLEELYGAAGRLMLNTASSGGSSVELELPFRFA